MFRSLVRMLGLGGETARTSNTSAKSFSPRVETLDGRMMPSTLHVAAGIDTTPAAVRSVDTGNSGGGVDYYGGLAGGVIASGGGVSRISSFGGLSGGVIANSRADGRVDNFGGLSGGVIANGGAADSGH